MYLLHRLPGQSREEFEERAVVDVSLAEVPGLRGLQRMLPTEPDTNVPCADAVEIWRFESLAALDVGMQSGMIVNACRERESWAKAQEALTTEERVIR